MADVATGECCKCESVEMCTHARLHCLIATETCAVRTHLHTHTPFSGDGYNDVDGAGGIPLSAGGAIVAEAHHGGDKGVSNDDATEVCFGAVCAA